MSKLYPSISIVTPSFNQSEFLQHCMDSVLKQGYPNLEYVIIDGGSTDESVEFIRRYEDHLTYWVSEKDNGQYEAINKGFAKTTGELMGWLNSDDMHCPWSLEVVAQVFDALPEIEWLTTLFPLTWNNRGTPIRCGHRVGFNAQAFFRGENLPQSEWYNRGVIQQESTFWRRSLWERCGGYLDTSVELAADFELWARFFRVAELYAVAVPIGGFRAHGDQQRSVRNIRQYRQEAIGVLLKNGGQLFPTKPGLINTLLPGRLRRLAGKSFKRNICKFNDSTGQWTVVQNYA